MYRFKSFFEKIIWPPDQAGRIARVVLGLLLAACVANLALSPDPAKAGIAARIEAGKRPGVKHYVATYNWYMAAGNAVLLLGLLAAIPLWVRPTTAEPRPGDPPPRPDAVTWLLLGGAVGVLLYFAGPRMDHSLWGDEEYTFRKNIHGEHFRKDATDFTAPVELRRVNWLDTVYGYRKPNNHIFQTILSRLSHEAWLATEPPAAPEQSQVGEWALRLPSLLAALATLPALVALGAALGQARVGGVAALLLAFHPWFQRYASEARGYAIVMLLTVLLALLLLLGLREGRWRWWILYATAQFLLMWCYVGALFVPLALNLFAMACFTMRWRGQGAWFRAIAPRWGVANLLSAMLFFQMMAPCLPMLRDYLGNEPSVPIAMGKVWFQDLTGYMLGGMDGKHSWGNVPEYQSWERLGQTNPLLFALGAAGTAGIALMGLGATVRRASRGTLEDGLVVTWALAPLGVALAHAQLTQHYYYLWYMIFALPGYAFLWGVGVEAIARGLHGVTRWPGALTTSITVAAALALILPALMPRLLSQRAYPVEPLRDTVQLMRPGGDPSPLTVNLVMPSRAYDPAYIEVNDLDQLRRVEEHARSTGRKLYIAYGAKGLAEHSLPEVMAEFQQPGKYREVATLHATWPFLTRHLYQLSD